MEDDFTFITTSLTKNDYGQYNTGNLRNNGESMVLKKPNILYRPLINRMPSDTATVLTAISKDAGQNILVFKCDKQISRTEIIIIQANAANVYPRIGAIYWLMRLTRCVGKLMANDNLEKFMASGLFQENKILIGRKFLMNVRALSLGVLELLRGLVDEMVDK